MSELEKLQAAIELERQGIKPESAINYLGDIYDANAKLDGIITCLGQVNEDGGAVLQFENLSMAMSEYTDRIKKVTTALRNHLKSKGLLD